MSETVKTQEEFLAWAAGLKKDADKMDFFKRISKPSKKYYEGKYGKGTSTSRLKIKSQYGGVSIKENN